MYFVTGLSYVLQQPPTVELAKTKTDIATRALIPACLVGLTLRISVMTLLKSYILAEFKLKKPELTNSTETLSVEHYSVF